MVLLFSIVSFDGIFILFIVWIVFKYLFFLLSMYNLSFVLFWRILFEWKYWMYKVYFDWEFILNNGFGLDSNFLFFDVFLLIIDGLIILNWVFIFLVIGIFLINFGVLKFIFLDKIFLLEEIFLFFWYSIFVFLLLLIFVFWLFSLFLYFFKIFVFWSFILLIEFKVFCNILVIMLWRIFVCLFVWCFIIL